MMLKTTNSALENMASDLAEISKEKVVFPVGISYRIIKNRLLIEQALSAYRMTKDELVNRYSNGKGHIKETDDPELFEKLCHELAELGLESVELDISEIWLDDIEEIKTIPLNVMSAISFMIAE